MNLLSFKRFSFLLLICLKINAQAQTSQDKLISLLADKPAKENTLIYSIQIPEWQNQIPNKKTSYNWTVPINESIHEEDFLFGFNTYPNNDFYAFKYSTKLQDFKYKKNNKSPLLLNGFLSTTDKNVFVKYDYSEFDFQKRKLISKTLLSNNKTNTLEKSVLDILNETEGKNQFKVKNANFYQTQDLDHTLVDIYFSKTSLEGETSSRKWITINNKDLTVKYNVSIPSEKGITLKPFGTFKYEVTKLYGSNDYKSFNYKPLLVNEEKIKLTAPGTDIVYAAFGTKEMAQRALGVAKVDMKTGKISFVSPPTEIMRKPPSDFFFSNNYKHDSYNYNNLWTVRGGSRYKDYEVLVTYSEKENTYMTVVTSKVKNENLQLVIQNSSGAYVDRATSVLPINHYRIRDLKTNSLISEYTLIASTPVKTSFNNTYMVFQEGTSKFKLYTLRERLTGKLIHKVNANSIILTENSKGILIIGSEGGELGVSSFWEYPNITK